MKKSQQPDLLVEHTPLQCFFRPHQSVRYTGELVNPTTGEVYTPPRRVKQSFVAECDINNILKQYSATGQLKHISANAQKGAYLDLPDDLDYQAAVQIQMDATKAFASLPSKTRDRFENDPSQFLAFMADSANSDEAVKLGLAIARPSTNTSPPDAPDSESSAKPPTKP